MSYLPFTESAAAPPALSALLAEALAGPWPAPRLARKLQKEKHFVTEADLRAWAAGAAVPEDLHVVLPAILLEGFDTPEAATKALLSVEAFWPPVILDPCAGRGAMAEVIKAEGYSVIAQDLWDWGYGTAGVDFLKSERLPAPNVFMNPPFSKAVTFVEMARYLRARKIVVFQRFAWWEGIERTLALWRYDPPSRVWTPPGRVTCWRFDIPQSNRRGRGTPTAHAFFVWEAGHRAGPVLNHLPIDGPPDVVPRRPMEEPDDE